MSEQKQTLRARLVPIYRSLREIGFDVLPPFLTRLISRYVIMPIVLHWKLHLTSGAWPVRLSTLSELDDAINQADGSKSDDELRALLGSIYYDHQRVMPSDPFSAEYKAAVMQDYLDISGRVSYDAALNEKSDFDFEHIKDQPFPYFTQSTRTLGEQLMMQGFVIRAVSFKPGCSILEFGPGWGNTTLHLAQSGFRVTAVDVFEGFTRLIQYRAAQLKLNIKVIQSDMLDFQPQQKYDVILFFECFHHCADHLQMLQRLHDMLHDDGIVVFGAEPISPQGAPWGIRKDGMAVWSIRKFGWFELGFRQDYFLAALQNFGWYGEIMASCDIPSCNVVIARKKKRKHDHI